MRDYTAPCMSTRRTNMNLFTAQIVIYKGNSMFTLYVSLSDARTRAINPYALEPFRAWRAMLRPKGWAFLCNMLLPRNHQASSSTWDCLALHQTRASRHLDISAKEGAWKCLLEGMNHLAS